MGTGSFGSLGSFNGFFTSFLPAVFPPILGLLMDFPVNELVIIFVAVFDAVFDAVFFTKIETLLTDLDSEVCNGDDGRFLPPAPRLAAVGNVGRRAVPPPTAAIFSANILLRTRKSSRLRLAVQTNLVEVRAGDLPE